MTITKYKDLSKFEKDNLSDWTTKVVKLNFDDEDQDKFGLTKLGEFINNELTDWEDDDKVRIGYPDGSTGDFYIPIKLIKGEFKKLLENHIGHKLDLFSNIKLNMDKNTRKLFSELKKTCNTKAKRKAYNNLVKSFSDEDPTPEQKGIIEYLKGWVLEHPGEAKYLVELGEKWGVDNLLEGLNHDENE